MSEEGHGHETLIIKRGGGGHHDEHHGGVWKIAFADFMTAMMAFFLVMWLISANDKTKATIAKYFNPIELVDSTPQPRGLNDTKKDDPNVERKSEEPGPDTHGKEAKPTDKAAAALDAAAPHPVDVSPLDDADQSARHDEIQLIRDPYAVIAEIAEKKSADPPKQATAATVTLSSGGTGAVGLKAGEAFRDPFEPQPVAAGVNPLASPSDSPAPAASTPSVTASTAVAKAGADKLAPAAAIVASSAGAGAAVGPSIASAPVKDGADRPASAEHVDDKPLSATSLRAKMAALVTAADLSAPGGAPKIDVRHTDEGTLISLTDSADFAMFTSASARPSAKTVALMGKIGRLLKAQKGSVTIRGYTDSRPFVSETYDNWRLSTERAHIAQYMLRRGGLEDARIDRIEGYADRHPKNAKDPESPENRRIEILLRDTTP